MIFEVDTKVVVDIQVFHGVTPC